MIDERVRARCRELAAMATDSNTDGINFLRELARHIVDVDFGPMTREQREHRASALLSAADTIAAVEAGVSREEFVSDAPRAWDAVYEGLSRGSS